MAIEKMFEFNSGIFGLPLRLLAREVYDKCVLKVGQEKVALITGEEKILPNSAQYLSVQ
jgi:ATP-dependent RNA helicase SUPV3L1/SUV3